MSTTTIYNQQLVDSTETLTLSLRKNVNKDLASTRHLNEPSHKLSFARTLSSTKTISSS